MDNLEREWSYGGSGGGGGGGGGVLLSVVPDAVSSRLVGAHSSKLWPYTTN